MMQSQTGAPSWYIVMVRTFLSPIIRPCMNMLLGLGGISLSPAFVVMYVMQYYGLCWEDALHLVQNRRYCISPNGGFMTQIKVGPAGATECGFFVT